MRAISYSQTGGPDVLRLVDRPVPEPGPGEVRVRLAFSGVNPTDWRSRTTTEPGPEGQVPGQDGAGTIDAVGQGVEVVHLMGGGARNALLCQLTADACGLPVVAGPVEAAALGTALVQARTGGAISGGLAEMRALLRATQETRTFLPSPAAEASWRAAEARVGRPGVERVRR